MRMFSFSVLVEMAGRGGIQCTNHGMGLVEQNNPDTELFDQKEESKHQR